MRNSDFDESAMAAPVIALFCCEQYEFHEQVPLARKRIDLVFVARYTPKTISVELKIQDWKKALWQAVVNFQVSQESYIAIWHEYVHRVEKHIDLLQRYGVGLISVERNIARVVLQSSEPVRRIPSLQKQEWYRFLLNQKLV